MYIAKHQIVGVLIAEQIEQAQACTINSTASPATLETSTLVKPAIAGVSRIWVHANYRKRHIATRLLDACCANLIFGFKVNKTKDLAFSCPTSQGIELYKRYTGQADCVLVFPVKHQVL